MEVKDGFWEEKHDLSPEGSQSDEAVGKGGCNRHTGVEGLGGSGSVSVPQHSNNSTDTQNQGDSFQSEGFGRASRRWDMSMRAHAHSSHPMRLCRSRSLLHPRSGPVTQT